MKEYTIFNFDDGDYEHLILAKDIKEATNYFLEYMELDQIEYGFDVKPLTEEQLSITVYDEEQEKYISLKDLIEEYKNIMPVLIGDTVG